jgi:hypothetical protein
MTGKMKELVKRKRNKPITFTGAHYLIEEM